MSVQEKLSNLYEWLVRGGLDPRGNIIMPWNHVDTAVEWNWMDLLGTPQEELEAFLQTATHPIDHFVIQRTLEYKQLSSK